MAAGLQGITENYTGKKLGNTPILGNEISKDVSGELQQWVLQTLVNHTYMQLLS